MFTRVLRFESSWSNPAAVDFDCRIVVSFFLFLVEVLVFYSGADHAFTVTAAS